MRISNEEKEIYGKLYDITSRNYDTQYGSLEGTRQNFLISVQMEANAADLGLLDEVPAESFLEAAFVSILKRLPEAEVRTEWEKRRQTMPEEEYKKQIISTLVNCGERAEKGISVSNNIFTPVQQQVWTTGSPQGGYPQVDKLYKIYMKLPKWARKMAKAALK